MEEEGGALRRGVRRDTPDGPHRSEGEVQQEVGQHYFTQQHDIQMLPNIEVNFTI